MRTRFLLVLALLLASAGCDSILDILGISPNETLALDVAGGPTDFNSLDDDRGLARLRVELSGAIERIFTAEDFPVEPFSVPDKGRIHVEVSLMFSGQLNTFGAAALGHESWALEPKIRWRLRLARAETPPAASIPAAPGEPQEYCNWRGCREYWRIEISDAVRNYEDEALWMVLYGAEPCPESDICD